MDGLFDLKKDEILQQKVFEEEEFFEKHAEYEALATEALINTVNATKPEINDDMPEYNTDMKESKRIKKEKKDFANAEKRSRENISKQDFQNSLQIALNHRSDDEGTQAALSIFDEELKAEWFSPNYLYEHYADVREQMLRWEAAIELFDKYEEQEKEGWVNQSMSEEEKLRARYMKEMYLRAKPAFDSAMKALGYTQEENGSFSHIDSAKMREDALKVNKRLRAELRDRGRIDEKVADALIPELIKNNADGTVRRNESSVVPEIDMLRAKLAQVQNEDDKTMLEDMMSDIDTLCELVLNDWQRAEAIDVAIVRNQKNVFTEAGRGGSLSAKMVDELNVKGKRSLSKANYTRSFASRITSTMLKIMDKGELSPEERVIVNKYRGSAGDGIFEKLSDLQTLYSDKENRAKGYIEGLFSKSEVYDKLIQDPDYNYTLLFSNNQAQNLKIVELIVARLQLENKKEDEYISRLELEELKEKTLNCVGPYLTALKQLDVRKFEKYSEDELIEHMAELQELYLAGGQVLEMSKCVHPEARNGESILKYILGNTSLAIFKYEMVKSFYEKARYHIMLKSYGQGLLDESLFSEEERKQIKKRFGKDESENLGANLLYAHVRELLQKNAAAWNASAIRFFQSGETRLVSQDSGKPAYNEHQKHINEINAVKQKLAELAKEPDGTGELAAVRYYKQLKSEYDQLVKKNAGKEPDDENYEEVKERKRILELEREMGNLNMYFALTDKRYEMADSIRDDGKNVALFRDYMFRSYDSIEQIESFRKMSPEQFREMCMKMSAGAIEKYSARDEEIEEYRKENVEGLMIYKKHMKEHYMALEDKFGHKIPDAYYIIEHYKELVPLFANIQTDENLILNSPDIINLTDEEDVYLYHLVSVYSAIGHFIHSVAGTVTGERMNAKTAERMASGIIEKAKESFEYVHQIRQGMPGRTVYIDKTFAMSDFRQLYEHSARINAESSDEAKEHFLERANKMKEYMENHKKDMDALTKRQFKMWYDAINRKRNALNLGK